MPVQMHVVRQKAEVAEYSHLTRYIPEIGGGVPPDIHG